MPVCTMRTPQSSKPTAPRKVRNSSVPANPLSRLVRLKAQAIRACHKTVICPDSSFWQGSDAFSSEPLGRPIEQTDAAVAGQLDPGIADIDTRDGPGQIEFDAFDPSDLHAAIAPEIQLNAGPAVGRSHIKTIAVVTADCVWRQRDAELGHGAQDGGGEAV